MPIILQLKGNDGSETHAVTVSRNLIYDSASQYVLTKTREALNWCCGQYGYNATLREYTFRIEELKPIKKQSRH